MKNSETYQNQNSEERKKTPNQEKFLKVRNVNKLQNYYLAIPNIITKHATASNTKKYGMFDKSVWYPRTGAMLISSVSFSI